MKYQDSLVEKILKYMDISGYNNKINNMNFKYFKNMLKIQIFN